MARFFLPKSYLRVRIAITPDMYPVPYIVVASQDLSRRISRMEDAGICASVEIGPYSMPSMNTDGIPEAGDLKLVGPRLAKKFDRSLAIASYASTASEATISSCMMRDESRGCVATANNRGDPQATLATIRTSPITPSFISLPAPPVPSSD